MIEKLVAAAKSARSLTTLSALRVGRTIASKGNGLQRVVVKGFGQESATVTTATPQPYPLNWRRVVKGFTTERKPSFALISGMPNRGRVQSFIPSNGRGIKRHFVYDVQPQRAEVQGFTAQVGGAKKVKGDAIVSIKPLKKEDIYANERRVIQGFGGDSTKPVTKTMDLNNTSPRTVVKGFTA